MTVFLDTNVFLFAAGREHPLREPCRELLDRVAERSVQATTSPEVIQEVLHVLSRRGRVEAGLRIGRGILVLCPDLLPVGREAMSRAMELVERTPGLPVRDAVHAGTMLAHGLNTIISADKDFDHIPEVRRMAPRAFLSLGS